MPDCCLDGCKAVAIYQINLFLGDTKTSEFRCHNHLYTGHTNTSEVTRVEVWDINSVMRPDLARQLYNMNNF
ncbi:MAG: hypothetical protein ABIA21_04160 [Candidatus Aenigmatarchaeota archaeon]